MIRCLLMESSLEEGLWPTLLLEVKFYCNNLVNGASGIAPHLLVFGRQPLTTLDARIDTDKQKDTIPMEEG